MKQLDLVLDMLKDQEGGRLHRNKSESDITTGYGIYKSVYPNAKIFSYIDEVAKSVGIEKKSKDWTEDDIVEINDKIDPVKEKELSLDFYKDYFKMDMSIIPANLAVIFCSIYVNSNKIANIALQKSTNFMIENYVNKGSILKPDGIIGSGSKKVIKDVYDWVKRQSDHMDDVWFMSFIYFVQFEYVQICTDNGKEDKQLQYLRGWTNRVLSLLRYSKF